MLLTLSERVTADLNLLGAIPDAAYVGQFCQVALEFLQTGAKKGMFTRAATALGVEPEVVAACIAALCHVLLESARANLSANELSSSLGDVAMTEAGKKTIAEFYTANQKALRDKLQSGHGAGIGSSPSVPEYRNLDWRLEIEVRTLTTARAVLRSPYNDCSRTCLSHRCAGIFKICTRRNAALLHVPAGYGVVGRSSSAVSRRR